MSPSRPTIRIRPRSAIADAALARAALTDLPGTRAALIRGRRVDMRALLRAARSIGRPLEPERVIVMPDASSPASRTPRR